MRGEKWQTVVAAQHLVCDGIVDTVVTILDVLLSKRIVGVCRHLVPTQTQHLMSETRGHWLHTTSLTIKKETQHEIWQSHAEQ